MRVASVFVPLAALASFVLAAPPPSQSIGSQINVALRDVTSRTKTLTQTLNAWKGDPISGSTVVCNALYMRQSIDKATAIFGKAESLTMKDVRKFSATATSWVIPAVDQLVTAANKSKDRFSKVSALPAVYEMLRAEREGAVILDQTIDKLPNDVKNLKMGSIPLGEAAKKAFLEFLDETTESLKPGPKDFSLLSPFMVAAGRYGSRINPDPFCKALPPLLKVLGSKNQVKLGDLATQILKVLKDSGVQDQVPVDLLRQTAESLGINGDALNQLMERLGASGGNLPIETFTTQVPGILKELNLDQQPVNPGQITDFVNGVLQAALLPPGQAADVAKPRTKKKGKKSAE